VNETEINELAEQIATRILLYMYHTEGEFRMALLEPFSGIVAGYLRRRLTSVPVDGCADKSAPNLDVERGAAATEHHR